MENEKIAKQIIIIRRDLKKMNKDIGKIVSQGGHATLAPLLNQIRDQNNGTIPRSFNFTIKSDALFAWLNGRFRKIVLGVDSEKELLDIYEKIKLANIDCQVIRDAGFTLFHGEETITALGIIPCWAEDIDPITGHLKLFRKGLNDSDAQN